MTILWRFDCNGMFLDTFNVDQTTRMIMDFHTECIEEYEGQDLIGRWYMEVPC